MSLPQAVAYTALMKAYLSSDHVSPATGKTLAVTICKAGAAFGNPSAGAANATEVGSGWYFYALSTTDTGTVGDLVVRLAGTGVDDCERVLQVVNANTGGLAALPPTACTTNASLLTSGTGADQLHVNGAGKVSGVVLTDALTIYTGNTVQTGDSYVRLGAPAGASIAADLAEIAAETDGIAAIPINPYTGTPPTAAAIATAVFQDTTPGDFTVAGSIGLGLFTGGHAPGAASGLALVGSNVGSATSVSGAVGSVATAVTLTGGERDAIAADVFKFDLSTLTGEANYSLLNAVRKLRNRWAISGTTLTVYTEAGGVAYTQALTALAGADPIVGIS